MQSGVLAWRRMRRKVEKNATSLARRFRNLAGLKLLLLDELRALELAKRKAMSVLDEISEACSHRPQTLVEQASSDALCDTCLPYRMSLPHLTPLIQDDVAAATTAVHQVCPCVGRPSPYGRRSTDGEIWRDARRRPPAGGAGRSWGRRAACAGTAAWTMCGSAGRPACSAWRRAPWAPAATSHMRMLCARSADSIQSGSSPGPCTACLHY